jgi:hypothetical protein
VREAIPRPPNLATRTPGGNRSGLFQTTRTLAFRRVFYPPSDDTGLPRNDGTPQELRAYREVQGLPTEVPAVLSKFAANLGPYK